MATTMEPFIIAETAWHHQGDMDFLKQITDEVAEIGVNAIKFHILLNQENLFVKGHPLAEFVPFEESEWESILRYAYEKELKVITLCNVIESIEFAIRNEKFVDSIEIHSIALNDYFLLEAAAKFDGRIILGIGGSTLSEIQSAIDFLKERNATNILLMYGFQAYPTDYNDINYSKMEKLKNLFELPIGYADHTDFNDPNNVLISVLPCAKGFNILEKHYTVDYGNTKRWDFQSAVDKKIMKEIVEQMKIVAMAHGDGSLGMTIAEKNYGNTGPMKKAIVARHKILKGEKLSPENLFFKRTLLESPIKQTEFPRLLGLEVTEDFDKDEIIEYSKIKYQFKKVEKDDLTGMRKKK